MNVVKSIVNGVTKWRVYQHGQVIGEFETEPNARLFAAAPQMRECLDYFVKAYRNDIHRNAPGHIRLSLQTINTQLTKS